MAYDENLAQRVRTVLKGRHGITEKRMFGGICFMVNGNMCCGVEKNRLMLRVGKERHDEILAKKHARPMDFTGRPMRGFVFVDAEGFKTAAMLRKWVDFGFTFAKSLPSKY